MQKLNTTGNKGLNGYQIKIIAVVLMTIDHFGAYGSVIPVFRAAYSELRLIGRLAAPLFFFMMTESISHTRSKAKLIARLYFAAVCVGLFSSVLNYLFADAVGQRMSSNILFDYFYITLYCSLIEYFLSGVKTRSWGKCATAVLGLGASCLPHYLWEYLMSMDGIWCLQSREMHLCFDLIDSFLRSPLYVDYTLMFTAMGIVMYFTRTKERKAVVLLLFSALCYFGTFLPVQSVALIYPVLGYPQCAMALAAPIILLYNGEKGRGDKYFFYLYYPLHRYAIVAAAFAYQLMAV